MIALTERAAEALKSAKGGLEGSGASGGRALRLQVTTHGLTFALDEPRTSDHVVRYQGLRLILVDEELAKTLAGGLIDVQEGTQGPTFTMIY